MYLAIVYMCRYVLLKERNKVLTLDHEAKRVHVFMPGSERLNKVSSHVFRKMVY